MTKTSILGAAAALSVATMPAPVLAKGCIRGAVAGAFVGHHVGRGHAVAGAAAGCMAGRAYYKHKAQQRVTTTTVRHPA